MWNGKNKAVTFSYDDGVETDRRLVEVFNRYGLKCTFNLNSGIMTPESCWDDRGVHISRMSPEGLTELYKGHEIAVHTLTHQDLTNLDDSEVEHEILGDKYALEALFNCEINGMAYPYGAFNSKVLKIARSCGMRFARSVIDRHDFHFPEDLLGFGATCHHNYEKLWDLLEEFLAYDGDEPAIFCLWGHSYEFEVNDNWDRIEELCRHISGHNDIFYGTNTDVYL